MPGDLARTLEEIEIAEREGRWQAAADLWIRVNSLDPGAPRMVRVAIALENAGELAGAEAAFLQAIEMNPAASEAYFRLGILLDDQDRLTDAKMALEKGLEIREDQRILTILASVLSQLGASAEAEPVFVRSLELDCLDSEAHFGLALVIRKVDPSRALAHFREAVRIDPAQPGGFRELGLELWRAGNTEEAERALKRAIADDESDVWAHDCLGYLYRSRGQLDLALQEFKAAIEGDGRVGMFFSNVAEVYAQMDDTAEAERWFREALSKDSADPYVNREYGMFLRNTGRGAKAEFYLRRALNQNPDDRRTQRAMKALEDRRGRTGDDADL